MPHPSPLAPTNAETHGDRSPVSRLALWIPAFAAMSGVSFLALALTTFISPAFAASGKQPAPAEALVGAPGEYTSFTTTELQRGFLALAFGSDLRIGARPRGVRRFDHPILASIIASGSIERTASMTRIIEEYASKVPNLRLSVASTDEDIDTEVEGQAEIGRQ